MPALVPLWRATVLNKSARRASGHRRETRLPLHRLSRQSRVHLRSPRVALWEPGALLSPWVWYQTYRPRRLRVRCSQPNSDRRGTLRSWRAASNSAPRSSPGDNPAKLYIRTFILGVDLSTSAASVRAVAAKAHGPATDNVSNSEANGAVDRLLARSIMPWIIASKASQGLVRRIKCSQLQLTDTKHE